MLSPTATIVQRYDPERFVAALFAPAELRESVFTLYAFNHEIARAREAASAPMLALIRLQWWREVVEGAVRRHEVAGPVGEALAAGRLDRAALLRMIAGREMEAEESVSAEGLALYLRETGGVLMAEAGRLLGAAAEAAALMDQGAGCAAVGLLRNVAVHRAQGRWEMAEGMAADDLRAQAAVLLGQGRRWSRASLPAALPGVAARRWLRRPGVAPLGAGRPGPHTGRAGSSRPGRRWRGRQAGCAAQRSSMVPHGRSGRSRHSTH